jgi:hypothetical protein
MKPFTDPLYPRCMVGQMIKIYIFSVKGGSLPQIM